MVPGFDRNPYHSSFRSAGGAYQHIEYVRADAKDCLRPASASFALHHAPPFVFGQPSPKVYLLSKVLTERNIVLRCVLRCRCAAYSIYIRNLDAGRE